MRKSSLILSILKIIFALVFGALMITTLVLSVTFVTSLFSYNNETLNQIKISLPGFQGKFSELKGIGKTSFYIIMFLITVFCAVETYLISMVIKILKKINLNHPFSIEISNLIEKVSVLALTLGVASFVISIIADLMIEDSVVNFELGGENFNFLIFAGIIYIIGSIYKKGVELQSENELTI